jgi:peptide/nickel transport system substrate-binding protein
MTRTFRASRLALMLLGLGALAACAPEPTATLPPPVQMETGSQQSEAVEEPTGDPDRLVFGHPADAAKLDPADVTDGESLLLTWHIYEGLTRYVRGSTTVEPALATEWTASDDGLEWTFTLREGVTFHDGTAFDADAVVWNFNRWFDRDNEYHFGDWDFSYWEYMFQGYAGEETDEGEPKSFFAGIEAIDPLTVKITLHRPSAPLLQNLAMGNFGFSSPTAVAASGSDYGTPNGNPIASGTGPYMVEEWKKDEQATLKRYDGYWGAAPAVERLEFRVIPDGSARYLALANGELDGMNQVNPEDIVQAEGNEDAQVIFEPANNVGYFGFNQANEPWDNLDCRLAVAHAIDKESVLGLYAGDAEAATQMMPPKLWGYNPAIEDYPYDLELAQSYLDACLETSTMPDEVVFYVPPVQRFYFPKPKELGELIQASLAGLGINADIRSPEWGQVWLPDVREGKHDIFLLGWGGDNGDPDNFLCQFFCGGDASFNGDGEGGGLPPDEALSDLLKEAATLSDQAERQAKYEEANQIVHDLVPSVPLVHRSPPLIFRSNVNGYVPSPIQTLLTTVTKE